MNLLICIIFGIGISILSVFVWTKYNAFSFELLKEKNKWKIFIGLYLLVTLGAFVYVGTKEYDYIVLCKLSLVYLLISEIALIDYKFHIIPNKILLSMIILRLLLAVVEYFYEPELFIWKMLGCAAGALVGFGILLITGIISKNGIGMGDAKLFGTIGLFLGINGTYNTLFYSLIILVIYSAIKMLKKELTRKSQLPFGPFIYFGYLLIFCMGAY